MQGPINYRRESGQSWRRRNESHRPSNIRRLTMNPPLRTLLNRAQLAAVVIGAAGLAFCLLGIVTNKHQFFISYLFAYLFWLGLALGGFLVTMIHHLTGGR